MYIYIYNFPSEPAKQPASYLMSKGGTTWQKRSGPNSSGAFSVWGPSRLLDEVGALLGAWPARIRYVLLDKQT